MNGILMALFGTLGTFLITALGAAGIFFVRREVSGNLQCGFLGFAGGVMIAASVWSLQNQSPEAAATTRTQLS